ncbi:MAG: peptidoglycan DD-metalloendopeptidase family protein [bacterium]|nr:peptidoglycan DD-metalloendopeptidase family protein [bacterium]
MQINRSPKYIFNVSLAAALAIACAASGFLARPETSHAQTAAQIRQNIENTNERILELQKEIDQYAKLLETNSKQAQTLQSELVRLETTRKKLESDLKLTTSRIDKANLTLESLSDEIAETEVRVNRSSQAVAQSIRNMEMAESQSVIQQFLNQQSLSEAWDYVSSVRTVQSSLTTSLSQLSELRDKLSSQQIAAQKERANLLTLQKNLNGQKEVVETNKSEQTKLLANTKNSASAYQSQLQAKIAEKERFEQELFDFESRLKLVIDPNSIPDKKSGVLSWPLSSVTITQRFGKTSDSGRLYTTGTHNGVDFRAAVGTPVKAVLTGTVWATGNTDIERGCYSYGRWILIKHSNGLTSLYAHLSGISVQAGETVVIGDTIGYSGNTGYSTGPHLHLGLFATQGVQVQKYVTSRFCKNTVIPMVDVKAYLDPLAYLPAN